jgi:hypothetical protein
VTSWRLGKGEVVCVQPRLVFVWSIRILYLQIFRGGKNINLHTGNKTCRKLCKISSGALGGPRSRVCTRLTLHLAPYRHQGKFFAAHVREGGVKKIQAILSTFHFFKKQFEILINCGVFYLHENDVLFYSPKNWGLLSFMKKVKLSSIKKNGGLLPFTKKWGHLPFTKKLRSSSVYKEMVVVFHFQLTCCSRKLFWYFPRVGRTDGWTVQEW